MISELYFSQTAPASNLRMIKLIFSAFIFFVGCNNNSRQGFLPADKKDINEIVEAVVHQDSLPFLKGGAQGSIPLSINLRKLYVAVPDTTRGVPPPADHSTVSIFNLFNSLVNQQRFFERADSSYFIFQNNSIDSFIIDKTITENIATTTFAEMQQKNNPKHFARYYDLTIPILSSNQKKAYIELTNNCSGCGGATAFYLERINGKWTVAGWQSLWMN